MKKSGVADVCMVLEGTYPFVPGGVSSWVHQIISSFQEFTFALAIILPNREALVEPRYVVPKNVIDRKIIFLHEPDLPNTSNRGTRTQGWDELEAFHTCEALSDKVCQYENIYRSFFDESTRVHPPNRLLRTKLYWDLLTRIYQSRANSESFVDYFWSVRFTHLPIFKIMAAQLPRARVYHTVSTGYAGLWSTIGKLRERRPLLLTEHGIYTRERRIEISRADWIYEKETSETKVNRMQSRFKEMWNNIFGMMSRLTYEYSDEIITLYEGNQVYQLKDGADPMKTRIIPNGVDVEMYRSLERETKTNPDELVLGFMGRVVSIKDVKTFIRTCKGVADRVPQLKVLLMGPTEEEPTYFDDCLRLTEMLGLTDVIDFTGKVNVKEYYPKIDILVLTSISEAQPLVILEANAMGIPCVATDVGSCRELLYGRTEDDKALGKSGLVAGVTDSQALADSILQIWNSRTLRERMGEAGKKRVAKYYNKSDLDNQYRKLYARYCAEPDADEVATPDISFG